VPPSQNENLANTDINEAKTFREMAQFTTKQKLIWILKKFKKPQSARQLSQCFPKYCYHAVADSTIKDILDNGCKGKKPLFEKVSSSYRLVPVEEDSGTADSGSDLGLEVADDWD